MIIHESTFGYLKPTADQLANMGAVRAHFADMARQLNAALPDGPDKTYIIRELRSLAMWANVSITRNTDGSPRQ